MAKRLTLENFIEKSKQVHGDKYSYEYVDLTNGAHGKVNIVCPIHGVFKQTPTDHMRGSGCKMCAYDKNSEKSKKTPEKFLKECIDVWGNRYDLSKVKYTGALKKIKVICREHGEFSITASDFINGHGCQVCGGVKKLTTKDFIERANKMHYNFYSYDKTDTLHKRINGKVCITCPIHGDFWQDVSLHLSGNGCPLCNESILEKEVRNFLEENNINYIYQANRGDLPFLERQSLDFYLPEYNIAIECQGLQHFTPCSFNNNKDIEYLTNTFATTLKRDKNKFKKCSENGVRLIYYFKKTDNIKRSKSAERFYDGKEIINEIDKIKDICYKV